MLISLMYYISHPILATQKSSTMKWRSIFVFKQENNVIFCHIIQKRMNFNNFGIDKRCLLSNKVTGMVMCTVYSVIKAQTISAYKLAEWLTLSIRI